MMVLPEMMYRIEPKARVTSERSTMRMSVSLLTGMLIVGLMTSACGSTNDPVTTPSAADPPNAIGSNAPPGGNRGPAPLPRPAPPDTGTCNAGAAQWAVGERASDDLLARARVAAGAGSARFIRPNEPITMEYLGSRLNLLLNHQDIVVSVGCG